MREILFRGKRKDNGEWIEGAYCKHDTVKICFSSDDPKTKHLIITDGFCDWGFEPPLIGCEVDPATVGQYTGLTDKNGKLIFEGDIVQRDFGEEQIGKQNAIVYYNSKNHAFLLNPVDDWMFTALDDCEVIGNIHDELLKGAD